MEIHQLQYFFIPPPRHASDNLSSAVGVPVPSSQLSRQSIDSLQVGSYNPPDSVLGTSSLRSPSSRIGDGEFSEDSVNWIRRSNSGKFASSLPNGGYNKTQPSGSKKVHGDFVDEKAGSPVEKEPVLATSSKPLKDKTTKAERRAMQEAQRAAKAAA